MPFSNPSVDKTASIDIFITRILIKVTEKETVVPDHTLETHEPAMIYESFALKWD